MGNPPCYDLTHMNLSDNIIDRHVTSYKQRIQLLQNYLKSMPKDKLLHDNLLGNKLNGEIQYNTEHLMKILNNNHHIMKNKITINQNGNRINDIYNKYNDRKGGFPGAGHVLFKYNKNNGSLNIQKIFFDGLLYKITTTNKEYNTKHIETNMIIVKKKKDNLFSVRYNDINKDNLDLVNWKKLDNIQDFSIKKNDQHLNGVIDDFDKEYFMFLNQNTLAKIKDNTTLMFKSDHSAALVGQKYSYNEEGTMIHYFKDTGMGVLECNRKKRIIIKIPILKPFRNISDLSDGNNLNCDGFLLVNSDISHHNLKTKNLEDKNIKVNKGSPIRLGMDEYIFLQKEFPDSLINNDQNVFLEKIFNGYNLNHYLNYTRIYNFFYLIFNQHPIEKMDCPSKKLSNNLLVIPKNNIGTNNINNFYWVKDNSTYFNRGSIILPSDHNGVDDIKPFEKEYEKDKTYSQYTFNKPLFEYFPPDAILSTGAYLTSIYKFENMWYVDFITKNDFYTKVPLSYMNITQDGLNLLTDIDFILYNNKKCDNLSLSCKPYVIIKCNTSGVDFKFTFKGNKEDYHFTNIQDGLEWVNTIEFNNKKISLEEFITVHEKLGMGSYIWDSNKSQLYWIPNVKWKFERFFFNKYEIDIQSNILFLLQKENDQNGQTKKLLLDKISNKKKGVRLNKNDVSDIIKLLKDH
tara:strand:- start:1550 stop:3604 length:2055 start_codon:yes stop_codon:yes gene_type:complete